MKCSLLNFQDTLGQWIRNGATPCIEGFGTSNGMGRGTFGPISNSNKPASPASNPASLTALGNRAGPWGSAYTAPDFSIVSANKCGSFLVQSSSPIAPSSISIKSENSIEGTLSLEGILPFLSTVALDGELPTYGAGGVAYHCGEGVAILSENYQTNDILSVEADDKNRKVQSNGLPRLSKDITAERRCVNV